MTNSTLRIEEYPAIAEFLLHSFRADRATFAATFPTYTPDYLTQFEAKLQQVKDLGIAASITEQRKQTTQTLYQSADTLKNELPIVLSLFAKAAIAPDKVRKLRNHLQKRNIEGAIQSINELAAQIAQHQTALAAKGLRPHFATTLQQTKTQLETLNTEQNQHLNSRKNLTQANTAAYQQLLAHIKEICADGKIIFRTTPAKKDEYTLTKLVSRVRGKTSPSSDLAKNVK